MKWCDLTNMDESGGEQCTMHTVIHLSIICSSPNMDGLARKQRDKEAIYDINDNEFPKHRKMEGKGGSWSRHPILSSLHTERTPHSNLQQRTIIIQYEESANHRIMPFPLTISRGILHRS